MASKRMATGFSDQITALVKALRSETPDCLAAGVVDMSTGMLLSYETVDSHPTEVFDLLAGATLDLFQGRTVVMIEDIFKERRGVVDDDRHYFQEIMVNSDHLTHLFIRINEQQDVVAVAVCRRTVNVGMLFAQARRVVKEYGM